MSLTPQSPLSPDTLAKALNELSDRWGWFVALGGVLLLLGLFALGHVVAATLVSVVFVGALMLLGGVVQLVHAWQMKEWKGFLFWTLSGVLYVGAGALAIYNPQAGASILTLLFGATLIGTGVLRLWIWFGNRAQRGWAWLALSGAVTLATGLLIAASWPGSSAWVLGLILSIDLIFQGWMVLLLGLALRQRQTPR
jgi:uncharacterized membrane protein HdeD (DUF308 family)